MATVLHTYHEHWHIPYTEDIWREKFLVNHAGKSYWRGKIWQINNSQCICYMFFVYLGILARKILANGPRFTNFSLTNIFPCMVFMELYCIASKFCLRGPNLYKLCEMPWARTFNSTVTLNSTIALRVSQLYALLYLM